MSDAPMEYNELVELIEDNDTATAAQVIQETHTPNSALQKKVSKWMNSAPYNAAVMQKAHELKVLMDE